MNGGSLAGRKGLWVCAALMALCLVWVALHVCWESPEPAFALSASTAADPAASLESPGEERQQRSAAILQKGDVAVNTATMDELCTLDGIGPSLAQAILDERNTNGPFYFPEDLLSVRGIGQKKLSGFVEQIKLDE